MSLPRPLDPVEIRVLGCLLEKEQSTPDQYPLTLNALVAACNQRSSREPVMELSDTDVANALDRLHAEVLVWPVASARAERWRHSLDRRLDLEPGPKALLTLLMLRGPQTPGELRGRSDRLHPFESPQEVESDLTALAERTEPLVVRLERQPGRKESRWAALLGDSLPEPSAPPHAGSAAREPRSDPLSERVSRLETELASLRGRLDRLEDGLATNPGE